MTSELFTRRLFIDNAAPLVAAVAVPSTVAIATTSQEPLEQIRAILRHFAAQAPDGAGRIVLQIGGAPEAFGYVAHAFVSSWVPDARLRGGGLWRDDAIELARIGPRA